MIKPLVEVGDSVRIPKGYVGVVTSSWYDGCGESGSIGWHAAVGTAIYRHEELEVVRHADRSEILRPSDHGDPGGAE